MRAEAPSPITHIIPAPASDEAVHLVAWREALIVALSRPGRGRTTALRRELRRVEHALCAHYWPGWRREAA